jgi:hypothetical protein
MILTFTVGAVSIFGPDRDAWLETCLSGLPRQAAEEPSAATVCIFNLMEQDQGNEIRT